MASTVHTSVVGLSPSIASFFCGVFLIGSASTPQLSKVFVETSNFIFSARASMLGLAIKVTHFPAFMPNIYVFFFF